nr:S8 family serine peptidase [Tessaracoccus sp. MC1756]
MLATASVPALGESGPEPAGTPGHNAEWFVELAAQPTTSGGSRSTVARQQSSFRDTVRRAVPDAVIGRTYQSLFNGFSVQADAADIARLADLPDVRAVYPVFPVSAPEARSATPSADSPLEVTGAAAAQSTLGLTGAGVKVGIIDTGVDLDHPDFGGNGVPGGTAFPSAKVAHGYDFVGDDYGSGAAMPDARPDDCAGHGTHVAGIVAADGGVKGVAPKATLGAYRVFGCTGGTDTAVILDAMERAQADGMDVVNLSLGASFQAWAQYPTAAAADRLAASGVIVVAAMGNDGANLGQSLGAPATGRDVIAVAAFENSITPRAAWFSSWGLAADLELKPDIGAPGLGIYSTVPLGDGSPYGAMSGTSMASPHVAGAVALLMEAHPGLTATQALTRLQNTALPAQFPSPSVSTALDTVQRQGAGLLRVDEAAAAGALVTPSKISAGEGADGPHTATLTISNPTTGAVTWTPSLAHATTTRPDPQAGNTQNTLLYGTQRARVTFGRGSVTVPPRGTAQLSVTVDAPADAVEGTVYGGFVVLTPDVGDARRVPFAGMAGDYGNVDLLASMNRGLTTLAHAACESRWGSICFDEEPAWQPAAGDVTYHPADLPAIAVHLAYPTRSLVVSVHRADARGRPLEASLEDLFRWDRMGRSAQVSLYFWDGTLASPSGPAPAPPGDYVLRVSAEAPDGDGRVQHWTSPAFTWGEQVAPTPTPTVNPTPTVTPSPTITPTVAPTPTVTPITPTVPPTPARTPTPPAEPSPAPSVAQSSPSPTSKPPATPPVKEPFVRTAPYTQAGTHLFNGRRWFTSCEPYSATERCRTDIWATVVVIEDGEFVRRDGWAFNNLTYLPLMTRAAWGANPLAHHDMDGFASGGRQWRTECDTARTGRGACRSYTLTTVYAAAPRATGGYAFMQSNQWVFNNIVMFS